MDDNKTIESLNRRLDILEAELLSFYSLSDFFMDVSAENMLSKQKIMEYDDDETTKSNIINIPQQLPPAAPPIPPAITINIAGLDFSDEIRHKKKRKK